MSLVRVRDNSAVHQLWRSAGEMSTQKCPGTFRGGEHCSGWECPGERPMWKCYHSRCSELADFELIIARSASAVTLSETSSINTNRKSTKRFPMSLRWSSHVVHKPPSQRGAQKRKVSNICIISCDSSETVRNWMSVNTIDHWNGTQAFDWYRPRWP